MDSCFCGDNCRYIQNLVNVKEARALVADSTTRRNFFAERAINVWNFLPSSVDFSSLATFRRSIQDIDFTDFLKCVLY